ncbi:helix-turn-helix domain-containing protein [Aeromonas crassostreae]
MERLGAMEALVLALETGSFSAAARRLGLGQAALSKLIAQQEARLGSPLLRSTRGLTLIERGGGGIPLARATKAGGAVNE